MIFLLIVWQVVTSVDQFTQGVAVVFVSKALQSDLVMRKRFQMLKQKQQKERDKGKGNITYICASDKGFVPFGWLAALEYASEITATGSDGDGDGVLAVKDIVKGVISSNYR